MTVQLRNHDYARLPNDVWLEILAHADTDALLAIKATASRFRNILRHRRLVAKIVCAPSSDEEAFKRFFSACDTRKVSVLDVSNCIVAAPAAIFDWVRTCHTLMELHCINCPLPYNILLGLLAEGLPNLQRLDWTFFGESYSKDEMRRITAPYNETRIWKLRCTYLEVACEGSDNYALLSFVLKRCVALQKLHLHARCGNFTNATGMCIGLAALSKASIPTLVYSTELDAIRGQKSSFGSFHRLLQAPTNFQRQIGTATVCGNLVYLRASTGGLNSSHTDAVRARAETPRFSQIIVALRNEVEVERGLSEAASESTWKHVEALTLTFLPDGAADVVKCAGPKYKTPLTTFLSSFEIITELNLNSFHFTCGVDCCTILAAVPMRLRALSLAPCGINRPNSLRKLTKVASKLDELDVRMNLDSVSEHCLACRQPFGFRPDEAVLFQQKSALRRFSMCNVLKAKCLDFIAKLRPSELRLSFMAWHTDAVTCNIGALLSYNDSLRSLVLRDRAPFRGLEFYRDELDALKGLKHLSLDVSTVPGQEEIQLFFSHMTTRLPVLETLHVHHATTERDVRQLTWLRQPVWRQETSPEQRQSPGTLLEGRPCIGCSMATFIGLAKPRHYRWNCL